MRVAHFLINKEFINKEFKDNTMDKDIKKKLTYP